jgi:hypothetical protein
MSAEFGRTTRLPRAVEALASVVRLAQTSGCATVGREPTAYPPGQIAVTFLDAPQPAAVKAMAARPHAAAAFIATKIRHRQRGDHIPSGVIPEHWPSRAGIHQSPQVPTFISSMRLVGGGGCGVEKLT